MQFIIWWLLWNDNAVTSRTVAINSVLILQELLTKHKVLCAEFLESNYDEVFRDYEKLLNSDNYVTRRQSLKLLGELLLDRHNFTVMKKYISNPDNLKLMMTMLKEKSRNIQFEAFHVFKVNIASTYIACFESFVFRIHDFKRLLRGIFFLCTHSSKFI